LRKHGALPNICAELKLTAALTVARSTSNARTLGLSQS
jgi:hypothetical protein